MMTGWIKVTEPNGEPVYISVDHIISVRSEAKGSMIDVNDGCIACEELPAEVLKAIKLVRPVRT